MRTLIGPDFCLATTVEIFSQLKQIKRNFTLNIEPRTKRIFKNFKIYIRSVKKKKTFDLISITCAKSNIKKFLSFYIREIKKHNETRFGIILNGLKHRETTTCLTLFFEGDTRKTPSVRRPVFSRCLMHCLTIPGTASHSPGGPPPPLSLSSSTPESLPVRAPPLDDSDSDEPPWKTSLSIVIVTYPTKSLFEFEYFLCLQEKKRKKKGKKSIRFENSSYRRMKLS